MSKFTLLMEMKSSSLVALLYLVLRQCLRETLSSMEEEWREGGWLMVTETTLTVSSRSKPGVPVEVSTMLISPSVAPIESIASLERRSQLQPQTWLQTNLGPSPFSSAHHLPSLRWHHDPPSPSYAPSAASRAQHSERPDPSRPSSRPPSSSQSRGRNTVDCETRTGSSPMPTGLVTMVSRALW